MMQVEAECLSLHQTSLLHLYSSPTFFHDFPSPSSSSSSGSDWLTDDCLLSPPVTQDLFSLVFPGGSAEFDPRLGFFHLFRAYGEAKASEQEVLAQAILTRLKDGSSPVGNTLERMAYHFVKASRDDPLGDHDHLERESLENFAEAFCTFYQTFPLGMFAHLAANSAIVNLIPVDAGEIHIVDFEIEEGIQWAPLIYEIASLGWRSLRLTSTRWSDRQDLDGARERFCETEARLCKLASSLGVKLEMEEIGIESLVAELRGRSGAGEFLAFNCMVGFPHMRSSSLRASRMVKFLRAAKDCIDGCGGNGGIIVLGDSVGLEEEESKGYSSFLESKMVQMQTLFKAMEFHFPDNLGEARIAMECLFLRPNVMSQVGFREWEEISKATKAIARIGLRPRTMCEMQAVEAKHLVREGESPYWVRAGRGSGNEMSLNYLGTKLARVSCWN